MRLLCVYPSEEDGCMQLFTYGTKENYRSSCNGGIFRVFRAGCFDEVRT